MNTEILLVPVVLGLVQVAKEAGLQSRWAPLLALAIAQLLGWYSGVDPVQSLVYGLSAAGLWSGVKATSGN